MLADGQNASCLDRLRSASQRFLNLSYPIQLHVLSVTHTCKGKGLLARLPACLLSFVCALSFSLSLTYWLAQLGQILCFVKVRTNRNSVLMASANLLKPLRTGRSAELPPGGCEGKLKNSRCNGFSSCCFQTGSKHKKTFTRPTCHCAHLHYPTNSLLRESSFSTGGRFCSTTRGVLWSELVSANLLKPNTRAFTGQPGATLTG